MRAIWVAQHGPIRSGERFTVCSGRAARWRGLGRDGVSSIILLLVALLVAIACAALGRPAGAEVLPLVPDPIDTAWLMRIADDLGAPPEQRLAMLPAHDEYKAAFRAFENREVAELKDRFLVVATGFVRQGYRIPERAAVEDLLDAHQRVLDRARAIDATLFDSLGPIVGAEQQPLLDDARGVRSVAVYEGAVVRLLSSINQGAVPNVEEISRAGGDGRAVSPTPLSAVERERLARYQRERLARLREAYGELRRVAEHTLDLIDEMGLRGLTAPELFERMQDDETQALLRVRFDEGTRELQASAHALSALNLRVTRELAAGREPAGAEALLDAYHTRAHDELYDGIGVWRERFRAAALAASPELRGAIEGSLDQFVRRDDRLIASLADLLEESRKYRTSARLSGEEPDPAEERAGESQHERRALAEEAEAALAALLPPEAIARLDGFDAEGVTAAPARLDEAGTHVEVTAKPAAPAEEGGVRVEVSIDESQLDDALSPPISRADLDFYLDAIAWDEDRRDVATELFDDYRSAYAAAGASHAPHERGGAEETAASESESDRIMAARSALEEIDRRLFEDLASLENDAVKQARITLLMALRRREASNALARDRLALFGREEAYLDLVHVLIEEEQASGALPQAAGEASLAYISTIDPLVAERVEIADAVARGHRAMERIAARESEAGGRLIQAIQEQLGERFERLRVIDRRAIDLNRSTLEQITASVPESVAWSLHERYNRRAWPDIYEDGHAAAKIVRAARELDGLTDPQRTHIDEIAQEYRDGYRSISDRMVNLRGKRSWDFESFDIPEPEDVAREIELARLGFDRDELSERARLKLKLTLTEEQSAHIGLGAP